MATTKTKDLDPRPRHQVTAEDYPGEWARRIELYLDEEARRPMLIAGLFGGFVLCIVIVLLIAVTT